MLFDSVGSRQSDGEGRRDLKRTKIDRIPFALPEAISPYLNGAALYDSSCSPEARVYLLDVGEGYYLKRSAVGTLRKEAEMTAYFGKKGLGAEVLCYTSDGEADYLLTSSVRGEDCTHPRYLAEPRRLAVLLGETLRALHESDPSGCPITDRTSEYLATADQNYRRRQLDLSFARSYGIETVEEAWAVLSGGREQLQNEVLLHGDYCLPNIMLDGFCLSGFIDVGNGGIGDRHVDLFWGAWTLAYNLGTDAYRDLFFDAYGKELVDPERLRTVAAAETFG